MRSRRVLYAVMIILLALAVAGYFVFRSGAPDANLMAKSEQVEIGMSLDALKALIGEPSEVGHLTNPKPNIPFAMAVWEAGDTQLRVTMNEKWEVTGKTCGTKSLGRRLDELFRRLFSPKQVIVPAKSAKN